MNWTSKSNELEYEWVKNQIENNSYYENIRKFYHKAQKKDLSCISDILECWEWFDFYYSLYTIMNSIEDYMEEKGGKTIEEVIMAPDFEIREA